MAYQTTSLCWRGIDFTLNFDPEYFTAAKMAHIEIRCDRSLPITETGYRSIFTPTDEHATLDSVTADILAYLDEEARKTNWRLETQLSLF